MIVAWQGLRAAVLDSNIMIDFLAGRPEASSVIAAIGERHVSVVARTEVLAGVYSPTSKRGAAALFSQCRMIDVDIHIADIAAEFRKTTRLKLPDALITATAARLKLPLVTRDLGIAAPGVEIINPYALQ